MEYLLFVRHAKPESCKDLPASKWGLSEEGAKATKKIVGSISKYEPKQIFTSKEPKAVSTASIIGNKLEVPIIKISNIHEHNRNNVKLFASKGMFRNKITEMFNNPDKLVFGKETANEAQERFIKATNKILESNEGNCVIVTHGTVITLYVSHYNKINILKFWKKLTVPCLVILEKNSKKLVEIVPIQN